MPSAAPVPSLALVLGDEELLVERRIDAIVGAARWGDPETEVTDLPAAALGPGQLDALLSPSLFGGRRCVVLREAQDVGKDVAAELLQVLPRVEDATVIVAHSGGAKGKALVDGLAEAGATVFRCNRVSPRERVDFVAAEFRAAGRQIDGRAAVALVEAVGSDLRELATAAAQVIADTEGLVDADVVARYHRGRADASGFTVADRAVEGDLPGAVELLRWALDVGVAPVLVTSALAANLRLIARVAGAGRSAPASVAKTLGQPVWKVERAQRWSRAWSPSALSAALRAVAVADAAVKGAAVNAGYATERAVLAVADACR